MAVSTRSGILSLLKRNGGASVAELAEAVGLAGVSVRQHLTRLERDGLVRAELRSGTAGRPRQVFRLTAKAEAAAFPRRSDRLIELLIREIAALDGAELLGRSEPEKTRLILERVATRLAAEFKPLLGSWPLMERVAFVTEVMHAEGGLAEWEATEEGYEIRDFNCLFFRLIPPAPGEACDWHRSFLSQTLDADVRPVPCSDTVEKCCRFVVATPAIVNGEKRTQDLETTVAQ
jgi:predicted ArsR family transcriptional regulator